MTNVLADAYRIARDLADKIQAGGTHESRLELMSEIAALLAVGKTEQQIRMMILERNENERV